MDILSLKNISFQNILANISLNVPQNGFITLSGPSGSGKSTLLKICARMLTQSTGELIFEGEDAAKIPVDKYRMQVSYCFQQPVLFGDTVADNLDFPFEIRKEPVKPPTRNRTVGARKLKLIILGKAHRRSFRR